MYVHLQKIQKKKNYKTKLEQKNKKKNGPVYFRTDFSLEASARCCRFYCKTCVPFLNRRRWQQQEEERYKKKEKENSMPRLLSKSF